MPKGMSIVGENNKIVTITTDGSAERLDAITKILGGGGTQVTSTTDGSAERLDAIIKLLGAGGTQITSTTENSNERLDTMAVLTDENANIATISGSGRLHVDVTPSPANIPVKLTFNGNDTAVNNYEWQELLSYTVPTGYNFNPASFYGKSAVAGEIARALLKTTMGSFVGSTDTFTDGDALTAPQFADELFVYVTTATGSGSNDVVTITYTNYEGTTGRTGTVTIPKSSPIGTRLRVTLQSGDYGVRDVTNCTHAETGQAGDWNIEAVTTLFNETLTSSGVQYNANNLGSGSIVLDEGDVITLWYKADSAVSSTRDISLLGSLVPQ